MRTRLRLIGASVAVVLAVSVLSGAALAAPPEKSYFTNVNADIDYDHGSIDISGESDESPATTHFSISIGFDIDGYQCGLSTDSADYFDYGDNDLDVNWSGVSDCGDGNTLFVQTGWYFDTHRERSRARTTGRKCKTVSQVDGNADVGVTIRVNDEDAEPIVDRVFESDGWYQTGKETCHFTGKPGNPQR